MPTTARRLVRRDYLEIDVEGASTDVPELVGVKQPALLLLNDEDHAYAKIRLDERSLATAISALSTFEDSLPRALVWGAAWDMTRDGEMRTRDWTDLVLANIGRESDAWAVTRIPASTALAVNFYSDPAHRAELRSTWESGLRELFLAAEPGSDHQLTFVRSYAGAAHSDQALDDLIGLLDGSFTVEGLAVDQDMRWTLITALAKAGRFGDAEIDAELEVDRTISGKEQAAAARVAQPTPEAKEAGWNAIIDPATPNETSREIAFSIFRFGQEDVLEPYLEKFLDAAETLIDTIGFHKASAVLEYGFPKPLGSAATLARLDEWLADNNAPKGAQRYVGEARAEIARALRRRSTTRAERARSLRHTVANDAGRRRSCRLARGTSGRADACARPRADKRQLGAIPCAQASARRLACHKRQLGGCACAQASARQPRREREQASARRPRERSERRQSGVQGVLRARVLGEHRDPALQAAEEAAAGELRRHRQHGQLDLGVGEVAAYVAAR